MENETIRQRLSALRAVMEKEKIDYYMIPTADFHNSEYVGAYFRVREYFCGFTGSNGTLLVWQEGAGLWTDGRYFIQAENELAGTGVTLFRMAEEGIPTLHEFLTENMKEGQTLGFDGRVVPAAEGVLLEKKLAEIEDELKKILTDKGVDLKILTKQSDCDICNDTGVIDGQICACARPMANAIKLYCAAKRLTKRG